MNYFMSVLRLNQKAGRVIHSYYARKSYKVSFKNNKIKSIQSSGLETIIVKYKFFDNKDDVLKEEIRLIEKYGRKINKSGILTNITEGGEGTLGVTRDTKGIKNSMYGKNHTAETKKKISDKNKDRIPHPISDSQKEAIKHRNSIRIISAETRKKMSDTRKGISYRGFV